MMKYLTGVVEIFGIVYLRFTILPRVWCVWLVAVNSACIFFIQHVEAQLVLGVTLLAVLLQGVIYQRTGFTRIMGAVHLAWIPMFIWMAGRIDVISQNKELSVWLVILLLTNFISLLIDGIDMTRYVKGERAPHYSWK